MDLETWRDIWFSIFAVTLVIYLIMLIALGVLSLYAARGINIGRRKLAEVTPRIQTVRQTAVRAERGVDKAADAVTSPLIKVHGLLTAARRGAERLLTGRNEGL
jgi:hypothetical protein